MAGTELMALFSSSLAFSPLLVGSVPSFLLTYTACASSASFVLLARPLAELAPAASRLEVASTKQVGMF